MCAYFFFSSRRRHTRSLRDWSSDVCSSDLQQIQSKRVRYVHPLRLYLLASILFFFAVNYWAKAIHVAPTRFSSEQRSAVEAALKKRDMPPEIRAEVENALNRAASPASRQTEQPPQATPTPLVDFSPSKNPSTPFEKWIETHAREKIGER